MKLYHSPMSPFVRKVMVLLFETGQLSDVEIVPVTTTPITPMDELLAKNPLAKIPALERNDGATLYDSRVICAFLDARAGDKLYPLGARKWETLTLEATADGILDAAVSITYEGRVRPKEKQWNGWTDAQWSKVIGGCSAINTRWMSHLSGPLDMGQVSVACALAYLDFRHDARGWRAGNDALSAWYEDFSGRESMQMTAPPAG
ncbi:glutathione S-transferase [bacterium]|nr:glutathione S-transferase [bacterium]